MFRTKPLLHHRLLPFNFTVCILNTFRPNYFHLLWQKAQRILLRPGVTDFQLETHNTKPSHLKQQKSNTDREVKMTKQTILRNEIQNSFIFSFFCLRRSLVNSRKMSAWPLSTNTKLISAQQSCCFSLESALLQIGAKIENCALLPAPLSNSGWKIQSLPLIKWEQQRFLSPDYSSTRLQGSAERPNQSSIPLQGAEATRKAHACPSCTLILPPGQPLSLQLSAVEALAEPEILSWGLTDLEGFFLYKFICALLESREALATAEYRGNEL